MKFLVVEDDIFLGDAFSAKLTGLGHQIELAQDGEAVAGILKDFDPDIIILDLVIPKKNGLTVLEELKKDPRYAKIPVIIASNLDEESTIKKGLALGAIDYFVKSNISIRDLVEKCEKIVAKARA